MLGQVLAAMQNDMLRLMVESATDFAIIAQDPNGRVISWNAGAERLLGYRTDEIIDHSGDVFFTADDRAAGVPERERATALRTGRAEDERWHVRKDGATFWGSGLLMPLSDPSSGFVKIMRDRTAQRTAELALAATEERFRTLTMNIPQLVFRSRGDGARTWGSPQWEIYAGLSDSDSRQFGWLDAVHPEDRAATLAGWEDAQRSGEYHVEHRIRRAASGEFRWHQTRARPVDGVIGAASDWVGTSADIHDLRELQGRQQVMLAELQHRTRNLLAVVQSIERQTLRRSESLEDFAAQFESRLNALSRVQSLMASSDYEHVDLRAIIVEELHAHGDGETSNPERVEIAGPEVTLRATPAQALSLALHELATNALKYGALAQPAAKLTVTWTVEGRGDRRWLVLRWIEAGVAMPADAGQKRTGYGRELIERALRYQLKAQTELTFNPDGVRCLIEIALPALSEENG